MPSTRNSPLPWKYNPDHLTVYAADGEAVDVLGTADSIEKEDILIFIVEACNNHNSKPQKEGDH